MHWWSCHKTGTRAGSGLVAGAAITVVLLTGAAGAQAATPAWQLVSSPNATLSGGQINSVSCSAASDCTAVGTYLDPAGINRTLAETWNGTAWQQQPTPNPSEDTAPAVDPQLLGVSCPTATFCAAVGTYQLGSSSIAIADTGTAGSWTSQSVPIPAGSSSVTLDQVSCLTAKSCEAVGSYQDDLGDTLTLAASWNGTAWRLQSTPNPSDGFTTSASLTGVSCVSATFCEASGSDDSASVTFAEQWNGTSWALQTVPGTSGVNAVSCTSATFCEAVAPGGAFGWNGKSWKAQTVTGAGSLSGVSCTAKSFCEAAGEVNNGNVVSQAVTWNGSAWTAQSTPNPATATDTRLNAVSCASASDCETAGYYRVDQTSSDSKALAEGWNGSAWALQAAVAPAGATSNTLSSVSCVSASLCEAVGSHVDSSGDTVGLAEEWNGSSWKVQSVPSQTSSGNPTTQTLLSVSCVSAMFCEAVGNGTSGADAEIWNGTSWQLQTRPGSAVQPTSVSCAAANFCLAIDGSDTAETWNGSSWSAAPALTGFSPVSSLSCVSASFCEAVGSGPSGQNAAVWNGTSWSDQTTAGTGGVVLNAVTCVAVNSCEAVGGLYGAGNSTTLAETWDGSTWTLQSTSNPAASQGSDLLSVSCTAASSCTAVGQYQYSNLGLSDTIAEVWDGTTWTLETTPNNVNAGQNILSGVSCGASAACTAVGQTQDEGLVQATLIESGD